MGALDYLRSRGLTAARAGQKLRVFPSTRITPADVEYIKLHRMELIAELAANDGEERRAHWRVCLRGELLCVIAGGPIEYRPPDAPADRRCSQSARWE